MPAASNSGKWNREVGLANLSTATKWAAGGAVALVGLFSVAAAHAFPGHSRNTTVPPSAASTAGQPGPVAGSTSGTPSNAPSNTLQAPVSPPVTSSAPPVVVSGGS